jgi:hypothetical protein
MLPVAVPPVKLTPRTLTRMMVKVMVVGEDTGEGDGGW